MGRVILIFLLVLGLSIPAMAADMKIKIPCTMSNDWVSIKTVCIDGFRYTIVRTNDGVSIVQVMEFDNSRFFVPTPQKCGE